MGENIIKQNKKKNSDSFHPKVSVVIPVYNGANYLRDAIDSALSQTYDNVEIIVVNDGSNDNGETDRIARSYGNYIRYFAKENGGVSTALNLGIEKMTGEYFSWLSHDDMYLPEKIETEVAFAAQQEDPKTIIVEGYQIANAKGKHIITVNLHKQYPKEKLRNPMFLVMKGGVNGCATLIHKSHFERVGMFDPNLPTTQDYDLWFRMFRNAKVFYAPVSNVVSRKHIEQGCKKNFESHIKECDQLWIKIMDNLSTEEKEYISETEFKFYQDMWESLSAANYASASQYAEWSMLLVALDEYTRTKERSVLKFPCVLLELPFRIIESKILPKYKGSTEQKKWICQMEIENYQKCSSWILHKLLYKIKKHIFVFCQKFCALFSKTISVLKYEGPFVCLRKAQMKIFYR